jgi:hypothetical protein
MQIFSRKLLMATDDLHGSLEFTTVGIHSFKLSRRTKAKLTIVGSGLARTYLDMWIMGRHGGVWSASSGGGYFVGCVMLPAGTYTVTLSNSTQYTVERYDPTEQKTCYDVYATINSVILSNYNSDLITVGTPITKSSNLEIVYGTVEHEESGNSATYDGSYLVYGGASLYNGYGKGSDSTADNQTSGYFKIEW